MKVKIGDVCTLKSGTSLKDNVLNDTNGIPYFEKIYFLLILVNIETFDMPMS